MNLKNIFKKLAYDVTKFPNIVQLTETLSAGFKDVADNIDGGGGGSSVEVYPVQTSGNKIASISVDGTIDAIYAPKATLSLSGTGNRTLSLNTQVTGGVEVSAVELPVGDTVSVNSIQTTGTTIAEITVNNVTAQIKAPNASTPVHEYSTTEQVVGKWIDNSDVYERVVSFNLDSNSNVTLYSSGISATKIISFEGAIDRADGWFLPVNFARWSGTAEDLVGCMVNTNGNINVFINYSDYRGKSCVMIIRYLKA